MREHNPKQPEPGDFKRLEAARRRGARDPESPLFDPSTEADEWRAILEEKLARFGVDI